MAENQAVPAAVVPQNFPAVGQPQNPIWRAFKKEAPIGACKLTVADLKRLYQILNARQVELRERMVNILAQQPNETAETFAQRRIVVYNSYVTGVVLNGTNGEVISGDGDHVFDDHFVQTRIASVTIDTSFAPKARINFTPPDIGYVHLDFSRPPLLNFASFPTVPTPNASNWSVNAQNEAWSIALSTRLQEFFAEKSTKVNWLHGPATYDTLITFVGWPFALWGSLKLGNLINANHNVPSAIRTAVYVFAFLLSLNIFRALLSYSRWVFPKIELESTTSRQGLHRFIWATLTLGVAGSAIWDGLKAIL